MEQNYLTIEQNLKLLKSHYLHTEDFPVQLFDRLSQIIQRLKVQPVIDFENSKLYWEYKINNRKLKFIFKEHLIKKNFMEVRIDDKEISTVLITVENINNFYMDVLLNIL